ncbi:hypothetical protein N8768_05735 [Flavobacteriaceae bacterium]|nr:hypothetical protein [Flavobacteriaceae bacterium]
MKKYLKNVTLFLLPVAIVILIPSMVLRTSAEAFYNINNVISLDGDTPYILGYAYNGKGTNYEYFKSQKTIKIKPDLLVLGSSRVLQFREYMFNTKFYNAGFSVGTIQDYLTFLKLLPKDYKPKLVIMGFDQWMFNIDYYNNKKTYSSSIYTENKSLDMSNGFSNLLKVYKEIFNGKINYQNLNQKNDTTYFGLNATINKKGFRNDGSFDYGINHKYYNDFTTVHDFFAREMASISNNKKYFTYGDDVSLEAIKKYEELLVYCANNNIKLVAFLPPLPKSVNTKMQQLGRYTYIGKIKDHLIPLSETYNSEFYDLTDIESLSVDDQYIDGHHGNEKIYGQALNVISKLNPDSRIVNFLND